MEEAIKLLIGILVLILGYPIGVFLAKICKDELKKGQIYFKILVYAGLIAGLIGLIIGNDVLLFTGFFIAIVTSRSLFNYKKKNLTKKVKRKD